MPRGRKYLTEGGIFKKYFNGWIILFIESLLLGIGVHGGHRM